MNRRVILLVGLAVATSAVVRSDGRTPVVKDDLGKILQAFGISPEAVDRANRMRVDPFSRHPLWIEPPKVELTPT